MDAALALSIILPIIVGGCTIATFFIARSHDAHKKGKDSGKIASDVEYIKRRVDDVLYEQRETNKVLDKHAERITRLEESTKSAHKRISALENKGRRPAAEE
jgi:peptidoglycan hydrolase CwlO-like protein